MFRLIAVIFIFISTILVADERTDIQNTISNQLKAFAADDLPKLSRMLPQELKIFLVRLKISPKW